MIAMGKRLTGLALVAGVALAACGGGGTGSSTVGPGHGSPQAVLAGLIQVIQSRNAKSLCQYFPPSVQKTCESQISSASVNGLVLQGASIGHAAQQGNRAIVVLLANKYCSSGGPCYSNHDPNAGLPSGSVTFTSAWTKALSGNSAKDPAVAMQLVNGQWYLATAS